MVKPWALGGCLRRPAPSQWMPAVQRYTRPTPSDAWTCQAPPLLYNNMDEPAEEKGINLLELPGPALVALWAHLPAKSRLSFFRCCKATRDISLCLAESVGLAFPAGIDWGPGDRTRLRELLSRPRELNRLTIAVHSHEVLRYGASQALMGPLQEPADAHAAAAGAERWHGAAGVTELELRVGPEAVHGCSSFLSCIMQTAPWASCVLCMDVLASPPASGSQGPWVLCLTCLA